MHKFVKLFLICFFCFFILIFNRINSVSSEEETVMKIRAGAFIKVMTRDEFSTLTSDIGDEVLFINTQDMYVYETNAIPKDTIFFGEIEDVKEPVDGRDGALKILVYKMITPDKKVYKINGYIYSENDNYIGGAATNSIYYHKVPHYIHGLKPFLQEAPLNVYEMGRHTVVKPGAELFIILNNDIILK